MAKVELRVRLRIGLKLYMRDHVEPDNHYILYRSGIIKRVPRTQSTNQQSYQHIAELLRCNVKKPQWSVIWVKCLDRGMWQNCFEHVRSYAADPVKTVGLRANVSYLHLLIRY